MEVVENNFDRSSAFNIMVVSTRSMAPATAMHDMFPKMATPDSAQHEYQRQAFASKDRECVAMRQNGIIAQDTAGQSLVRQVRFERNPVDGARQAETSGRLAGFICQAIPPE